jgi:hypothetical protein
VFLVKDCGSKASAVAHSVKLADEYQYTNQFVWGQFVFLAAENSEAQQFLQAMNLALPKD